MAMGNTIKNNIQKLRFWALTNWEKFYGIATGTQEHNPRRFLFTYFSWMMGLLFLSFSFLAEKNPFQLLLPMQVFALPIVDDRSEGVVYVSDGESEIYPTRRKVFLRGNMQDDIRELIEEVGRPPHFSQDWKEGDRFQGSKLKKLPNLSQALVSVWILDEGKRVVLDFSSKEIERAMAKYRFAKSKMEEGEEDVEAGEEDIESYYSAPANYIDAKTMREIEEKKVIVLRLGLKASLQTIRENFPSVDQVEYRLDGVQGNASPLFQTIWDI